MRTLACFTAFAIGALAAPPSITEFQPRGAQKDRPFVLKVVGQNLGEGVSVISSLPATFTLMGNDKPGMESRIATFLVEPSKELKVGVYPLRVQSSNGLSNILLFSIGVFPEISEAESEPGAQENSNDSIEKAESLPGGSFTLNGRLRGPERDVYRIQAKANERRVFEVDARRSGSAIDPVITLFDGAGKMIARSEDSPLIGLDARLDVTFSSDGYYYIDIRDARFSTQAQDFYRLKSGVYDYANEIFPLGGKQGEQVSVSLSGKPVKVDLASTRAGIEFVNLPGSPALPLPFAVGTNPELTEPVTTALPVPVTVNGRLAKSAEVDRYKLSVQPGDEYIFELEARELGTSKLMGVLTVYDKNGKSLASAGDGALPVDVFAVQASSRTAGDPVLPFKVPDGVTEITLAIDDLAQRGGALYAYRLHAQKAPYDPRATITTPFANIPAGGTAMVNFNIDRRGYDGALDIKPVNLPEGITFSGGHIPAEAPDPQNMNRMLNRRAMATLTAAPGAKAPSGELTFVAVGKDSHGNAFERPAGGIGYVIGVAGATAQGVVDRQRALTGNWLGAQLPAAIVPPLPVDLDLELVKSEKKEAGYEFIWRWTWKPNNQMQRVPETVSVDVPNFNDLRVIEMEVDKSNPRTGTFKVTSTKNTLAADYNIGVSAPITFDMQSGRQQVYSVVRRFTLPALDPEEKPSNAPSAAAR